MHILISLINNIGFIESRSRKFDLLSKLILPAMKTGFSASLSYYSNVTMCHGDIEPVLFER